MEALPWLLSGTNSVLNHCLIKRSNTLINYFNFADMLTRAARPCWTPPSWGTWHHSSEQLPAKLCQQPWLGWPMLRATGAQRIIIGSTAGQLGLYLTVMHQQLLWCRVAGKRLQGTVVDTQSGKAVLELWDEDHDISIHQQLMQVELFVKIIF